VTALLLLPAVIAFGQDSGSGAAPGAPQGPTAPGGPSAPESSDISDLEIEQFVSAFTQIQAIQQGARQEIDQVLQESEMEQERFMEIYQSQQQSAQAQSGQGGGSGDGQSSVDMTDAEQQTYQETLSQIVQVQRSMQTQVQDAIAAEEIEMQRFNQIYAAISQRPQVQERVRTELQKQQQQQQQE
jgi:hypothetical protein